MDRLDAMDVPIFQDRTQEVDDQGSDRRGKDEDMEMGNRSVMGGGNKMNDQQLEAENMAMHGEQEKAGEQGGAEKIETGPEQVEDVKMEGDAGAETNETGGEDMEAEDSGAGGDGVEGEKVEAIGEQVEMVTGKVEQEFAKVVDDDEPVATDPPSNKKPQPDVETGEPPLVLRVNQWQQKPKGKAKAGPKAKAKRKSQGKGKQAKTRNSRKRKAEDTVEVMDSAEEGEASEQKPAKASQKKRAPRKARAKTAAQTEPSGNNEQQATTSDSKENKEPPIKYKPVTEEGKADIEAAFNWEDEEGEGQDHESIADSEAEEPAEEKEPDTDEPKIKNEPSFARRPPPKTSPSRDRWLVIRDVFNQHLVPALTLMGLSISKWEAW